MRYLIDPGPGGWLLVLLILGMLVANELGYRFGRRSSSVTTEAKKAQGDLVVAGLLGMLGLLLAFSFGIVNDKFAQRRQLVIDDANAIGKTYLRAEMMPAPHDARIEALLRRYVAYRVGSQTPQALEIALAKSGELHAELWAQATELARAYPNSVIVGRFVESLNQMIDTHESRVAVALYLRLPEAIMTMLYAVALLSLGMIGYRSGLDHARSPVAALVLVLAITIVLALILDLDRPVSRLFRINQRAMTDVQTMMQETPARGASAESAPAPRG
jgi:hypothetical protein